MTSPGYMTPRDPNGPSLENIHAPKCTCGAAKHLVNKETPRLRLLPPLDPVDRVVEEARQLHMWEDLQDGDTAEPERLSTINDILEVLKLLARKV